MENKVIVSELFPSQKKETASGWYFSKPSKTNWFSPFKSFPFSPFPWKIHPKNEASQPSCLSHLAPLFRSSEPCVAHPHPLGIWISPVTVNWQLYFLYLLTSQPSKTTGHPHFCCFKKMIFLLEFPWDSWSYNCHNSPKPQPIFLLKKKLLVDSQFGPRPTTGP